MQAEILPGELASEAAAAVGQGVFAGSTGGVTPRGGLQWRWLDCPLLATQQSTIIASHRERGANHDLNRLLQEPGLGVRAGYENSFLNFRVESTRRERRASRRRRQRLPRVCRWARTGRAGGQFDPNAKGIPARPTRLLHNHLGWLDRRAGRIERQMDWL